MEKRLIGCIMVLLALCIAIPGITCYAEIQKTREREAITPGVGEWVDYEYPVNENGQTYGIDWHGDNYEENAPDLIAATGENETGKEVSGYVKQADLMTEGDFVKTPEEALAWNRKSDELIKKQGYIKKIPVYESDGETMIGEFYIGEKE